MPVVRDGALDIHAVQTQDVVGFGFSSLQLVNVLLYLMVKQWRPPSEKKCGGEMIEKYPALW